MSKVFDDNELARIEQIAGKVAEAMLERVREIVKTEFAVHREDCPLKAIVTQNEERGRMLEIRVGNLKAYGIGWFTGVSAFAAIVAVGIKCLYDYFKH